MLALMLLLVAVTAAYWNAGEPIRNDPPLPGGLMSGQIGGRSVQIEDRQLAADLQSACAFCKSRSKAEQEIIGFTEGCKDECTFHREHCICFGLPKQ